MTERKVYMDHIVTTPLREEVLVAMMPFLQKEYGNAQSLHSFGEASREAIEEARARTAGLIGASAEEIIFTSSGAEANNLALKGAAEAQKSKGNHIISSPIEHFSVLYPLRGLEKRGYEVTYLPVDQYGLVDPAELKMSLRGETILVSIMTANNEIGTLEPVTELARVVKENSGAVFHTDAVAAAGQIAMNVAETPVDLLSLSAHQFYGPKGAGALFLRKGTRLLPQIEGGIQEGGRRAGTENVAAIVGMGRAAEIAAVELEARGKRLRALAGTLKELIENKVDHIHFTGHPARRLPGHLSFCVEFIEGEAMLILLDNYGIAAASGSTCTSKALKASHVLTSIGLPPEIIQGSLVLSLGEQNDDDDVAYFADVFSSVVEKLRQMSPLYTKYRQNKGES